MRKDVRKQAKAIQASLGKRLQAYRGQRGLTQEALAHRSGISVYRIRAIENGTGRVLLDDIFKLARALEIPAASLVPDD